MDLGCAVRQAVVDYSTERVVVVLAIRVMKPMTHEANNGRYKSFSELLKLELLFVSNPCSITDLLNEAARGKMMNDNFRALTGLPQMISGLKEVCRPTDDIHASVASACRTLRPLVASHFDKTGVTRPLPNMEHYGEMGRRLTTREIVALSCHIGKDPDEFSIAPPLVRSNAPVTDFVVPRHDYIGTSMINRFYRIRFGNATDPQLKKEAIAWG